MNPSAWKVIRERRPLPVDSVRVIILFIFRIPLTRFSMKRDITSLLLEVMLCEWNAVKSRTPHNLYVPNFLQMQNTRYFFCGSG